MTRAPEVPPTSVRALDAVEAEARLEELFDILVDAVAHGASVNFMAGFSHDEARVFWRNQFHGIAKGQMHLFVGEVGGRLLATSMLMFASHPNARHRHELDKILVNSPAQQPGMGRRLRT